MMQRVLAGVAFLLSTGTCFAQTPLHGLVAGKSIRADVETIAGRPVKVYSQTLVEYNPVAVNPTVWGKNITKLYVQYRVDSPIIERLEVLMDRPYPMSQIVTNLNGSISDAHQPKLPDQAAARGQNGPRLVEYFGAPHYIVLTYEGADEKNGVSRVARYSKELYDSAVRSATLTPPTKAAPPPSFVTRAPVASSSPGSVTGHWSGLWTNSHGGSGQSSMTIREQGGVITGEEDGLSESLDAAPKPVSGWTIFNGRRSGNVLTWQYRNQHNNCRDVTAHWELSADGNLLNGTYQVNDRCNKEIYTGHYMNYHR